MPDAGGALMRIVIVEDNSTNLAVLCRLVARLDDVEVAGFASSRAALEDAQKSTCDLMVVDNIMPDITGLELVALLRRLPSHRVVPIVMVTADADRETRLAAINAGATDFLAKPVDPMELEARLTNLLALRTAQNQLEARSAALSNEVAEATEHLRAREEDMIYRLARAIEMRDDETSEHVVRVAQVARLIAAELHLDDDVIRTIWLAAPLHDVGKIGIADAILKKPGRLDPQETAAMRQHAMIGAQILDGGASDLIRMAADVARSHHERWDGRGYPQSIAGETIPLAARITAVADVFDALCSARSYKPAWPVDAARAEIERCSGTQFDPACVRAFLSAWDRIAPIYRNNPAAEAAA
jgi:putative two-component system response regulator